MTQGAVTPAVPPPLPRARPRGFVWVAPLVLVCAAVVYHFDPASHQLLPPCPLHALTGLYCPGCGATRALHQLLHGHPVEAFDLNPLVVGLLPVFLVVGTIRYPRIRRGDPWAPSWAWGALIALAILFGIARNLPWPAVRWMAP